MKYGTKFPNVFGMFLRCSILCHWFASLCTAAAANAAKSLQLCPTLCDSIDGSPPGSPILGILQARVLEWGVIAFSLHVPMSHYFNY